MQLVRYDSDFRRLFLVLIISELCYEFSVFHHA